MGEFSLPEALLSDVVWSFTGPRFDDEKEFSEKVLEYQIEITGAGNWVPNLVALPIPKVLVSFPVDDEDCNQKTIELVSSHGEAFTSLDLLFQIHNSVVESVEQSDHHFNEGLRLNPAPHPRGGDTLYNLILGS